MSDIFKLFFYSDFRLCLRKAGSSRTDSESIEFHITGPKIHFHNRRNHHYHNQFPGVLSVVSSVCLRNFFVNSLTCTGLPLFLRCESQFEASFRIRVSSIHSASLHFYFWSSKLWRSYYSRATYFYYFYCFLSIIRTPAAELLIHFLVDPPPLFSIHHKFSFELQKWKLLMFYFVLHFIY